jgi:GTP-binding protein EngB required for normal cell division
MVAFASNALSKLCSKDQLTLLDSIDRLRLQGINNYISLPQIIVCGDQSSGKSSVLEAISGVSFPVKSNLCTRFPTELVLRKTPHISASVSIVPHESRAEAERAALLAFREELVGFEDLPGLIEKAKSEMGITTHGRAFAKDILRIEVTGPDRPHLTIVDLPGLIHSETKNQTASDVHLIQEVVNSYMKEPRCIILAVVSAKNDFANQVVLKLARAADPRGVRTLGVITKPDTLVSGGESEANYVSLARNQEIEFRHGWHVLKNMDSEKGGSSDLLARDAEESLFFSSGVWTSLPLSSLGIDKLRGRLSRVLLGQIATELPSLMDEIEQRFKACETQLEKLGDPRSSPEEQRLYLVHLSQSFQALVKSSADGNYDSSFFADAKTTPGYEQRIRAVVQNLNEDFASKLSLQGHYRQVIDGNPATTDTTDSHGVVQISRDDFIEQIEQLMRKTRGRELPGTFNPMIVIDLFREQSRPWEEIARRHVESVWEAASSFVKLVIAHTADSSTAKALQHEVFGPAMTDILKEMRNKTTELLKPLQSGHPVTYNHYFAETLQKMRESRRREDQENILRRFLKVTSLASSAQLGNGYYDLRGLSDALIASNEPDVKRHAAGEAMDCLNAYYKASLTLHYIHLIPFPVPIWAGPASN